MSKLEAISNLFMTGTVAEFGYFDMQILFCKSRDLVELITRSRSEIQDKKKTKITVLNKTIDFKNIKIGSNQPVFIIAEAGMNHNGSVKMAKQLIDEAKKSGCNVIKFQSFKAESRVSAKVKAAKYAEKVTELEENFYEMFKKYELSEKQHKEIFDYAKKVGMPIFSSAFDEEHADLLEKLGVDLFKIASMDLTNIPLISHIARKGKPIILSTGMGTLGEIEEALDAIRNEENPNVVLLHCISAYPCPPEQMNLKAINTLQENFKVPVGLSDHSIGNIIPISAVTRGAVCIEKHFTLDKTLEGPDHILSADPKDMRQLVKDIREVEKAQGTGEIQRANIEYNTAQLFKKSIFAKQDIKYGTVISKDMLTIKGPALGIKPKFINIVIGRKAKKNINADFPIYWEYI
jgi:N-acetylneuraminate synthase